jgi:hypothetical protein
MVSSCCSHGNVTGRGRNLYQVCQTGDAVLHSSDNPREAR